eukprot:15301530-Alexandrium_andersonii.AAC.1
MPGASSSWAPFWGTRRADAPTGGTDTNWRVKARAGCLQAVRGRGKLAEVSERTKVKHRQRQT